MDRHRRYRQGWFGKVVLQLEIKIEEVPLNPYTNIRPKVVDTIWRDAKWNEAGTSLWAIGAEFFCPDTPKENTELTGHRRYRRAYIGHAVILQVEVKVKEKGGIGVDTCVEVGTRWRDACRVDLIECRNIGEGRYQTLRMSGPHDDIIEKTYDK